MQEDRVDLAASNKSSLVLICHMAVTFEGPMLILHLQLRWQF